MKHKKTNDRQITLFLVATLLMQLAVSPAKAGIDCLRPAAYKLAQNKGGLSNKLKTSSGGNTKNSGSKLLPFNLGTEGTYTRNYHDHLTNARIRRDIRNERYSTITIGKGGAYKFKQATNAQAQDHGLIHRLDEIAEAIENNQLTIINGDINIILLESIDGSRDAVHPHLLTSRGNDWQVAHAGSHEGEGQYIYMTRAFFTDASVDTLIKVLMLESKHSKQRYDDRRHNHPLQGDDFDMYHQMLLSEIEPLVAEETDIVRQLDVLNTAQIGVNYSDVGIIRKYLEDALKELRHLKCAPVIEHIAKHKLQLFREALQDTTSAQAITAVWGAISFELQMLSYNFKEIAENAWMKLFFKRAEFITQSISDYTAAYGLENIDGVESGIAVGPLKIIDVSPKLAAANPDKTYDQLLMIVLDQELSRLTGDEIVVVPYLPEHTPFIKARALITSIALGDHVKAAARGQAKREGFIVPYGVVPNGVQILKTLAANENEKVLLTINEKRGLHIRTASAEEISKEASGDYKTPYEHVSIALPRARTDTTQTYFRLADIDRYFVCIGGPKACHLGHWLNHKGNAIDGIMIPYAFYHRFLKHNSSFWRSKDFPRTIRRLSRKAREEMQQNPELARRMLRKIQQLIVSAKIPEDELTVIRQALTEYEGKYGASTFYIRSAFNFEDLEEDDCAGVYETIMAVDIDEIVDAETGETMLERALKEVMAAKWKEAALRKRIEEGISEEDVYPSISIHPTAIASLSGTMYTVDTSAQGYNKTEISGNFGQGNTSVDGLGYPATATVNKVTREVDMDKAFSEKEIRSDVDDHGNIVDKYLSLEDKETPVFDESTALGLSGMAKEVEAAYHYRPQQIEWLILKSTGEEYITQIRPYPEMQMSFIDKMIYDQFLENLARIPAEQLSAIMALKKAHDIEGLYQALEPSKTNNEIRDNKQLLIQMVQSAEYIYDLAANPQTRALFSDEYYMRILDIVINEPADVMAASYLMAALAQMQQPQASTELEDKIARLQIKTQGAMWHSQRIAATKVMLALGRVNEALAMTSYGINKLQHTDIMIANRLFLMINEILNMATTTEQLENVSVALEEAKHKAGMVFGDKEHNSWIEKYLQAVTYKVETKLENLNKTSSAGHSSTILAVGREPEINHPASSAIAIQHEAFTQIDLSA